MTENIVTGKKYRILTDATQDIWDRISFWTKASDVYYDDNSTAETNRPIGILKRSTAYVVGTVAYEPTAPSWVMLRCTTAGTTAASTPSTYKTISSAGTVITDGTAKFTVYDIRPTGTLSTSAYTVPTVGLLNTQISNLAPQAIQGQSTLKSVAAARFLTNGINIITISPNNGNPQMQIDATSFLLMKNLTNGNAFIKSITLNYSGNPWKLNLVINVDGGDYNKTINLG